MKINIEGNLITTTADSDLHVVISGARGPQGEPSPLGVPYTGATQDVNLGEFGLQTGNIEFDNTPTNTPTTDGSLYWDDTSGTLSLRLKGGNVISKVGETQHIRAYNDTGNPIAKGKVVYVTGAQGQRLTIDLADADTELLSKDTIGITAEAIEDGAEGFVIVAGILTNINTNGLADGDTVYLSQTAGSYTNVAPADPAHLVILGFVVNGNSGGAGSIYVKVDNGYELEELHNVSDAAKTSVVDNDAFLLRDSADNNLWKRLTWSNLKTAVKTYLDTFKGVAGGYASLDGSGKVPSSELPSYVDDVIEAANFAALPVTGETGKIYVTLDNNKCYRWSGSVYIQVAQGIDTLTTTGTSGAATLVGSTLNIPQYQSVLTNPVTGTGTAGQVAYFNGTTSVTGSSNLIYDAVNNRFTFSSVFAGPQQNFNIYSGALFQQAAGDNNKVYIGNNSSLLTGDGRLLITPFRIKLNSNSGTLHISADNNNSGSSVILNARSTDSGSLSLAANNKETLKIFGTNNVVIQDGGTFTDNGQRLQVYGSTLLRGSGTTSATTALLVQNSTPTELFKVADNGLVTVGINLTVNNNLTVVGNATISGTINSSGGIGATSGTFNIFRSGSSFAPTSGTSTFTSFISNPTINQTGGANGITRGLYVNPTLTAAADWRSVEFSNNTGWGIYGAGDAPNYLNGNLLIDSTNNFAKLYVGGFSSTTTTQTFIGSQPVLVGALTNLNSFWSNFVGNSAVTITNGYHFIATQSSLSTSTITNQFGFHAQSSLTGATNNYGFYGDIASGTGRWNLYMNGTAANYLAGVLKIGSTPSNIIGETHIEGGSGAAVTPTLTISQNGDLGLDWVAGVINFYSADTSTNSKGGIGNIRVAAETAYNTGRTPSYMAFYTHPDLANNNTNFGATVERMRIHANGNTSIGTTTSSGRLTVKGSGTTSATKAFVVNNATPTALLEILDNGRINQTIPGATDNTIFGTNAGASASLTGGYNSFFGVLAGSNTTTGLFNGFFGWQAGLNNTTGGNNSFFGSVAGQANTTGSNNSFFGVSAGRHNTTGGNNSFFGENAGRYLADGTTSLTVANSSIFIGNNTRANADSQSNQIVIGYQAIGNGSNTATLGNTSITATYLRGNINYTDGGNFVFGTTTGTKIGTATSQKIGFYNATPVVQRTTTSGASTLVGGGGTALTDTDTFDGYTLATVVKALRDLGLLA